MSYLPIGGGMILELIFGSGFLGDKQLVFKQILKIDTCKLYESLESELLSTKHFETFKILFWWFFW